MRTVSAPRSGIAEQANGYFFRPFCGALLQVVSPRPATPTIVLRAHLFTIPRRRAGLGHLSVNVNIESTVGRWLGHKLLFILEG